MKPVIFSSLLALLHAGAVQAATFERFGDYPGTGSTYSEATAVSADGSIVGGGAYVDGPVLDAVRWIGGDFSLLGKTGGGTVDTISVTAMNGDGSKIVGGDLSSGAYLWNNGLLSSLQQLQVAGPAMKIVNDISDNGTVLVGTTGTPNLNALLWLNGVVTALPYLDASHTRAAATAVSADGTIVVGYSGHATNGTGGAFRREGGQMTALGYLEQDTKSVATDISADGSVIVGNSENNAGNVLTRRAFMWKDGLMTKLPDTNPELNIIFERTEAVAVSGDGSVIVGLGYDTIAERPQAVGVQPVLWSASSGYVPVPLAFLFSPEELLGFKSLDKASDVSRDGTTIVGTGTNEKSASEGFRITLDSGPGTWAGYPVHTDGQSVDTGTFLGWIDISSPPWVYVYALGKYVYLPENFVTPSGSWTWIGP